MNYKEDVRNLFSLKGSAKSWDDRYKTALTLFDQIMQDRRDYALKCCLRYSKASEKIIDVGCGAGPLLERLREHGYNPIGLDYSTDMLRLARKRCCGRGDDTKLLQGDCERLPFADNQFNMVISLGVISYIKNDMKAVSEFYRILKPDGIAIVSVRNTWNPISCDPVKLARAVFSKSLGGIRKLRAVPEDGKKGGDDFEIGRFYNPLKLRNRITQSGFSIKEMKGIGYGPFKLNDRELFSEKRSIEINRHLDRLFNQTGVSKISEWFTDVSLFVLEKKK